MATEVLYVPEQYLAEVIGIIRLGLMQMPKVTLSVRRSLSNWCNEEEAYLKAMAEDT